MKVLLKNANVYDGSGHNPYNADIIIENDKIAKIGQNLKVEADKIFDLKGLTVAPGFIDAHSHNDFFYDYSDAEKYYRPFLEQGITTQITGNCGFSPFGVADNTKFADKVGGGLFHAVKPGSFKDFIARAKGKLFVNVVPLIGQGTTRISISGYNPTPLSKEEITKEMELVEEAMQNGAFGGSFGFMYEPGIYAKTDELLAFAKTIAKYDGIVTVHPRACSKVAMGYPIISKPHIEIALDEVVEIMVRTQVKMEYSHLIFVGKSSWNSADAMLKKFHDYNDKGYKIAYDNYAFTYGASVITVVMPPWYMALSAEDRKKPFNIFKLKAVVAVTRKLLGIEFSDLTVAYISDDHKEYEGKTVSECAKIENMSDFDMYLKLVELSNGQGRLYLDKYYNDELIERLMQDDLSIFMTDAWVEGAGTQNGSAYQCFPYFLVRARNKGMNLSTIIRKMTGATADRFGIQNRGYIKEGYFADLTIFDYENVKVDSKVPDFKPQGIKYVFVNGKPVVENGKYVSQTAGQLILKK